MRPLASVHSLASRATGHEASATSSQEGVDGSKKFAIIGGSLRQGPYGVRVEGSGFRKRGVDGNEKAAMMGGSLDGNVRHWGMALRPHFEFFESMRRYLVRAPAGVDDCPSCRRLIKQ